MVVVVCTLWIAICTAIFVWSFLDNVGVGRTSSTSNITIWIIDGKISFQSLRFSPVERPVKWAVQWSTKLTYPSELGKLRFWIPQVNNSAWQFVIALPIVYFALPALLLEVLMLVRAMPKNSGTSDGLMLCESCNYPLGATQVVCPECGLKRSSKT